MLIIKIGGGSDINLHSIIQDLAELKDTFIIVHGGNAVRDELAETLNIPKRILVSESGYSSVYSDKEAINLILMTYAGLQNKKIVELCQQNGINAVGLTGLDGRLIQGKRNAGIRIRENNKRKIVRDRSGKPININTNLLKLLLDHGFTPVLTIPIIDENNYAINSENDDIVVKLQEEINADKLLFLIEAPGLLLQSDDPSTFIQTLTKNDLEEYEKSTTGRIKRKYHALNKLASMGSSTILIGDGRKENPIKNLLSGIGTIIK